MAYLINASDYFIREYAIPNLIGANSDNKEVVDMFIDERVRLFFLDSLGKELFDSLNADIDTIGNLKTTAAQRWKDLVNGKSYTKDSKTYYWPGLVTQQGTFKGSLLVPLVYYAWLENEITTQSGVGEVALQGKNAVRANSTRRLVAAANDCKEQYQADYRERGVHYLYKGVPVHDYFGNGNNERVSMRKFVLDNADQYPDAPMPILTFPIDNQLGI